MNSRIWVISALVLGTGSAAQAATASLSGIVVNSCILAVPTPGLLVADASGTTLRSDSGVGARAATLTVIAVGTSPTLTFAAPQFSGPAGVSADSVQFAYTGAGSGASRGFAATSAIATANLIDTFTVNGKISRSAGFSTGTYAMTVDVTCGQ